MKTVICPCALFSLALVTFLALAPQALSQTCSGNVMTFTNSILASDPDKGGRHEVDGVASACAAPKTCTVTAAGTFRYDKYTLQNTSGSNRCYTVTVNNTLGCGVSLSSETYSPSLVPGAGTICNNYLADSGVSITAGLTASYSFNVANGVTFDVVVLNRNTAQVCTGNYSLAITPCPTLVGACPTLTGTVTGGGSMCAGASKTVTVTVSGGGVTPYTVALNNSGGTQTGVGAQTVFNFSVSPASTTTYSVDSTASHDNNNCQITGSGSATATVNANPGIPTITATPSQVCAGSTGNQASAPASSGYAWSIAGGTITSAANIQTITYTAGSGTFVTLDLTVTNASGCTAANSRNVPINAAPATPTITPTPSSACPSSTGNQASGPAGATTYSWTISNGTITSATNLQTITYTAGASGNVGLTLRVSNAGGCTATNSLNVSTLDAIPPTVACPTNITVTASGNCPAVVAFTVSGNDN
jgi:hypothetical protein